MIDFVLVVFVIAAALLVPAFVSAAVVCSLFVGDHLLSRARDDGGPGPASPERLARLDLIVFRSNDPPPYYDHLLKRAVPGMSLGFFEESVTYPYGSDDDGGRTGERILAELYDRDERDLMRSAGYRPGVWDEIHDWEKRPEDPAHVRVIGRRTYRRSVRWEERLWGLGRKTGNER